MTVTDDGQENATWEYTYDQGGNILTKKKYVNGIETESMNFEYTNENWRDQLTKVNDKTITYDKIGNPLNDGTWTYTWQNGRQLQKMQKSGETVEFVYNENGLRVKKTAIKNNISVAISPRFSLNQRRNGGFFYPILLSSPIHLLVPDTT